MGPTPLDSGGLNESNGENGTQFRVRERKTHFFSVSGVPNRQFKWPVVPTHPYARFLNCLQLSLVLFVLVVPPHLSPPLVWSSNGQESLTPSINTLLVSWIKVTHSFNLISKPFHLMCWEEVTKYSAKTATKTHKHHHTLGDSCISLAWSLEGVAHLGLRGCCLLL